MWTLENHTLQHSITGGRWQEEGQCTGQGSKPNSEQGWGSGRGGDGHRWPMCAVEYDPSAEEPLQTDAPRCRSMNKLVGRIPEDCLNTGLEKPGVSVYFQPRTPRWRWKAALSCPGRTKGVWVRGLQESSRFAGSATLPISLDTGHTAVSFPLPLPGWLFPGTSLKVSPCDTKFLQKETGF